MNGYSAKKVAVSGLQAAKHLLSLPCLRSLGNEESGTPAQLSWLALWLGHLIPSSAVNQTVYRNWSQQVPWFYGLFFWIFLLSRPLKGQICPICQSYLIYWRNPIQPLNIHSYSSILPLPQRRGEWEKIHMYVIKYVTFIIPFTFFSVQLFT